MEAHCRPDRTGPDGKPLYMDVAWVGPDDADVVLLSLSGTHGAEGFNGSAAQVHWLNLHGAEPLPKGVAMLFVHAVNPFGFAHMLRVNENNVDLNRSEEHTSELQSLMRISYAVFCLKKKTNNKKTKDDINNTQQKHRCVTCKQQ